MIGLSMLNAVGLHWFDDRTVIQFALPRRVLDGPMGHTATTGYSWRLNKSYHPRDDCKADIAALPRFLLIAGRKDEAFVAGQYEPLMSPLNGNDSYTLLDGVGHLDVVNAPATAARIKEFLK